jgi:malonyl-CoA O-methyltransferase
MPELLSPRDAYELWAETYPPVAHNPLMRVEEQVVVPILRTLRAARALDVGTGSGRYLPLLEATGARLIVGVDLSRAMLSRGSSPLAAPAAAMTRRVCGDACRLPVRRGAFDVINASLTVGDVADLEGWMREMARALAWQGHLVYSDFHPSWAQHGWSRTFRTAAGVQHDVAYHARSIDDHLAAIEQAGLRVHAIREPRFAADRDPGIKAFRKRWGNPQVVAVFHAIKDR